MALTASKTLATLRPVRGSKEYGGTIVHLFEA